MNRKIGFDNEKYIRMQSKFIGERVKKFGDKLYLELGGKLFDDYHASRVLPGFEPDTKIKMLLHLREKLEIVIAISAIDIVKNKVRSDYNITYDLDTIRLIKAFQDLDLLVGSVVITQYSGQEAVDIFKKRLENMGIKVFLHYPILGYPSNVEYIVSDMGFGKNEFIETTRPIVVVTAPGPGSGKMATCLSQLYHENKRGVKAGYAKFETFPVWNLPLKHHVNLAYEAATVDLNDVNMIDPFHLEAYGETTVNYNRDIEVFPVLNAMFEKILGESPYKSPTDMGVNMAGNCIIDDDVVCRACKDEIVRRYYQVLKDKTNGKVDDDVVCKMQLIMKQAEVTPEDRGVVQAAKDKAEATELPACAIELPNGKLVTGKTSALLGASSAALLNALKAVRGLSEEIHVISPDVIEPLQGLKTNHFGSKNPRLHTDETLIALSICAANDPIAKDMLDGLSALKGAEAHSTVLLSQVDENVFKKLGIHLTSEAVYHK
ncbi:MAG: DUF1846 domain-containing protein [Ruminococcaceae bacterium]|nr:DUF1846 domain-containing protein [Oscillospiraceae bacterium]